MIVMIDYFILSVNYTMRIIKMRVHTKCSNEIDILSITHLKSQKNEILYISSDVFLNIDTN